MLRGILGVPKRDGSKCVEIRQRNHIREGGMRWPVRRRGKDVV